MVAIVEPSRPTRRAHARQCVGSGSCARDKTPDPGTDRNQQYIITALTDGGGAIVERHAYTAYGQVTFADASGTVQTNSASNNRYTYTGREWDNGLILYHYRARMYDAVAGRFVSRDPIGFAGSKLNLYRFAEGNPKSSSDPSGLKSCKITIYGGHNNDLISAITSDYPNPGGTLNGGDPWLIPDTDCIVGVGCGINIDVDGDGNVDSFQDYLNTHYPCNSITAPTLCNYSDPRQGLLIEIACGALSRAFHAYAPRAARRMLNEMHPNSANRDCKPACDEVEITVKCDDAMREIVDNGTYLGNEVPRLYLRTCSEGLCDAKKTIRKR